MKKRTTTIAYYFPKKNIIKAAAQDTLYEVALGDGYIFARISPNTKPGTIYRTPREDKLVNEYVYLLQSSTPAASAVIALANEIRFTALKNKIIKGE